MIWWRKKKAAKPETSNANICVLPDHIKTVYAIGDVHGMINLCRKAEATISDDPDFNAETSLILYLGDLVDRGPESAFLLDYMAVKSKTGAERMFLLGNHEAMMLSFLDEPAQHMNWLDFGGYETLNSYGIMTSINKLRKMRTKDLVVLLQATISERHKTFMGAMVDAITSDRFFFAHAGVVPDVPLVQHYIESQVQKKIDATLVARDIISKRVTQAKGELELAEDDVEGFLADFTTQYIDQTNRPELLALEAEIAQREQAIATLEASLSATAASLQARDWNTLDEQILSDASRNLISQRDKLNAQLIQPDEADLDIESLKAALAVLDDQIAASTADDLSATRLDITSFRTERDEFEQNLRGEILNADLPAGALTDLYQLQQEGVIARSQYQNLLQRLRQLDSMAELQISDASLVSAALEPTGASFPNRRLTLALSIVLGLMAGTGLGLLNEFVIGGVVSEDQLADLLRVPSAVVVPALSEEKDPVSIASAVINAPMSGFAESFRQLKHTLESQMARKKPIDDGQGRVILVTSAVPFEGKTTSSTSLARTLALAGNRVVIVDMDLRKPSISERIGVEPNDSLLRYLSKELDFEALGKAYGEEKETGLSYLVGGGRAKFPTDALIGSPRAKKVFEVLREGFDYVIIDSAPVLPVVDTLYLAPFVDAVVMAVRFASTAQRDAVRAHQRIMAELPDDVTFVPMLTLEEGQRRRAYYYRGYYHGYGQSEEA